MEFSPETIFISYSRTDGRAFAEHFERRLEREAGIESWRDLKSIEGGEDIRPQVLRAIERVKHLVLILSRRALVSDWVKREWTYARTVGRKVSPVLADPTITNSDLPGWIRRADVYDISEPERWRMLVRVLEGPGETRRVPYMSGDVPGEFVPRPAEYEKLKHSVLSAGGGATVAVTTALLGAGGYGKTTLANQLCRDPDVRFEFTDGILRVEIGKEREDVTGLVIDLIEKLDPQGKRPGFQDIQTASEHLAELIGEAHILLVLDDIWREVQLRPFLRGGPNCVRLVTTRLPQVLPRSHAPIAIDEMRANEALSLIAANLPGADLPGPRGRLAALADRLGAWAQMLSIANGWLCGRIAAGETLSDAIDRFERRLRTRGLTAFDPKDEVQRNLTIRACVEASLEDLDEDELARLGELAILPEDEEVPLEVIEALWMQTGGLDEDQVDDLIRRFHGLSLLQSLDLGARTLRLHDNMISYLRKRIGPDGELAAHQAIIRSLSATCNGEWERLPAQHAYGWRFLIRHLRGSRLDSEADRVLVNYAWIKAKIGAVGIQELLASYLPEPETEGARLVGKAIALSLPALATSPRELARQLYGRLGAVGHGIACSVAAAAREDEDFRPRPRWPGLTAPGAERLRLIGHDDIVSGAEFSPDGNRVVTASHDGTARIWDAASGREIYTLRGHEGPAWSAVFSSDGARIATASDDRTARVWDGVSGGEIAQLRGHEQRVGRAAFSPDGARIITASVDCTARIWDAATGRETALLRGHESALTSATFSPDGARIVTSSTDCTARIWDAVAGQEIAVLRGHEDPVPIDTVSDDDIRLIAFLRQGQGIEDAVTKQEAAELLRGVKQSVTSATFSPDGARIVTACIGGKASIWDAATGREIAQLRGHEHSVMSAVFSPDGACIATASGDGTARIWIAATGREITLLRGHEGEVTSAAFSPDGTRVVTASHDRTARIWDASSEQQIILRRGHEKEIKSVAFSADGGRIVTASADHTARIWNAETGQQITASLRGHENWVWRSAFSPDGGRIVTASADRTARIWDAVAGYEKAVLRGHDGQVRGAAFSPDGILVVTASYDRTARIWDAIAGHEKAVLRGHEGEVSSAVFSPDGARIVTASRDGTARVWDAVAGCEKAVLRGHEEEVTSAAFSPDGTRIVTASRDGTARIWDAVAGYEKAVLRGHEETVSSASFSPDGARIVTASGDRTARIWDLLRSHFREVSTAAFSPDGTCVVTASGHSVLLWDATTGTEIMSFRGHESWISIAAFAPDGTHMLTASYDRTARIWDAKTGKEIMRIALDAAVTALAVNDGNVALGDALGRIHVFEAEEFIGPTRGEGHTENGPPTHTA
jgi:WD40 repeat protein